MSQHNLNQDKDGEAINYELLNREIYKLYNCLEKIEGDIERLEYKDTDQRKLDVISIITIAICITDMISGEQVFLAQERCDYALEKLYLQGSNQINK